MVSLSQGRKLKKIYILFVCIIIMMIVSGYNFYNKLPLPKSVHNSIICGTNEVVFF